MTVLSPIDRRSSLLQRTTPLAGVLFAGLTVAGDLAIGPFPDGSTPASQLAGYYAGHASQVALGGTLLTAAAVCFAVFGAALWARAHRAGVPGVVPALVLVGVAVDTAGRFGGAATYQQLAAIGIDRNVPPDALQAWHIAGADYFSAGGLAVLLLGLAVAGLGYRALPRWLAGAGLAVAALLFTPVGFEASLLFLPWAAAAGIALTLRPVLPPAA